MSRLKSTIWHAAIILVSAVLSLIISWRAPALELYARDLLMRARGSLATPDDIVIVAIDEAGLKRFGRFPWPRSLMARAIDNLKNSQPKAIALDVLYIEPTGKDDDAALAAAIERAGNVVVAAQLTNDVVEDGKAVWLSPLPEIETAAAAVGHVNVFTGFDGVARLLLLRETDDDARALWAMAVELIRVGDGLSADAVRELPHSVSIGNRIVPMTSDPKNLMIESEGANVQTMWAARLMIDYIGPAGSFASQTISFGDLIDGRVAPEKLRGKYVLIGATAAAIGERVASPMIHAVVGGRMRSELMSGVEILANQVNTILRGRFYRETTDWMAFICAALIAALVIIFAALAQGNYETVRQIVALCSLLALILIGSYLVFSKLMWLPPLAPMLVAFATAAPLTLLRRSILLSGEIDARIEELSQAGQKLSPSLKSEQTSTILWPRGAGWKARELRSLNQQLVQRGLFVDRALRSIEDGLIIADADAKIGFANPRAAEILDSTERALIGRNLFECISEAESFSLFQTSTLISRVQSAQAAREALQQLVDERRSVEREISLISGSGNVRYYALRVSTVNDEDDGAVYGIVAVVTDITRQRELQRTQRDVMALVTHELKTPLTAIQGMSEVLSQYEVDAARRREMHLTINDEAKRLTRMIDEYLDLTRLESGARQLRLAPLRIDQIIERVVLLLAPMAERCGVMIIRDFAPDLPPLLGDADLIARAATNLVDNAVKFSPPNSAVTVTVRADAASMLIEVADEGGGIAPEFLPRIFEKFYRAPRVADVDVPGAGLGLALAREIAELHSGRLTVESKPGVGSIFSIRLPLERDEG